MKQIILKIYETITHFIGRLTKKYYYEDYVRVYPDQIKYNRFGKKMSANKNDINNYLNHRKFYGFVGQFAKGKRVADVGCGSGYGVEILKNCGAAYIHGFDLSKSSISFATSRYKNLADFSIASITDMNIVKDDSFDIVISSEVMEHIKEYNMESKAIEELKRIAVNGGLIIIGTPNIEMSPNHGFSFDEINDFFKNHFTNYCIFENALFPLSGSEFKLWKERVRNNKTATIISQNINFDETYMRPDINFEVKKGIESGFYNFANYKVDTTLLHNTHSWVVLAENAK